MKLIDNSVKTDWKYISIVVVLGLVVGVGVILLLGDLSPAPTEPTPAIVQQTPPPQPSPSPQALDTSNWQNYRSEEFGFEVRYPQKLDTNFIRFQSTPKVTITPTDPNFVCTIQKAAQSGEQKEITLHGQIYCVKIIEEGAAGSIYKTYQYKTLKNNKDVILEFVLRFPTSCKTYANYTDQDTCEAEQNSFNPDTLADQILSTFRFVENR